MKANIGTIDKIARILIGLLLIALFIFKVLSGTAGLILVIVAAVLLLTAFINFCPIWHVLGISTRKKNEQPE